MSIMNHGGPIMVDDITSESFPQIFERIIQLKKKSGVVSIIDNPPDLFSRAKLYGTQYKNGSWNFTSNIWNRSQPGSVVIEKESDLEIEHKQLMLRVLEHILCQPLIQVDATIGTPDTISEMKGRLYCDAQFPDIAYRWQQLNFPGDSRSNPDVKMFIIPHYLENPNVPGKKDMLRVIRFPNQDYTIATCSSYQGEVKKAFLSHWIIHVYEKGGTGEHASLKEFTVRKVDGSVKRIIMGLWGLSGSGKSTHGLFIFDDLTSSKFREKFGVDVLNVISDQLIRNDDIVGLFPDRVFGSEKGSWTKTEDLNKMQVATYRAAMSSSALHENTEFDLDGNPSFDGKLFQYWSKFNQNARSVFNLKDTGCFDGDVASSGPLNMAVFISPGYVSDYAWLKINDSALASKLLADGRTIVHPAQSRKNVGSSKYEARYCYPFTMGVGNASHIIRFYEFIKAREDSENPVEIYLINTTGRVGAEYDWVESEIDGQTIMIPKAKFHTVGTRVEAIGGTGPSIDETELFLLQASCGAVEYEEHPLWGNKILSPSNVPGLTSDRLNELNPFTYRSLDEMKRLITSQIEVSKLTLRKQAPGLPSYILNSMDF